MAISLNSINKTISYDTRIDYYIDLYKFSGELLLSFRLPILLPNLLECYCFDVAENHFQCSFLHNSRKVIVAGTRNWISAKDNQVSSLYPNKNPEFFTSLIIAIEIKSEEIPACTELFSKEPTELTAVSEGILQNALEAVLYRYNEKTNGTSFWVPSYIECDRIDLGFYVNFIEKRFHRCHFNRFHYPLIGVSETPIRKEDFQRDINNWRYFFSKAKYEYTSKKYVDCIIASAISIESYAWEKARSFCADDQELEQYTIQKYDNGEQHPLSATQLYKKLKDDNLLCTDLSKTKIEKYVQKILNPRNEIMHGKKTVAMSWGENAYSVLSTMIEFYGELSESTNEDLFLEDAPYNDEQTYRDYVLKCQNNSFESLDAKNAETQLMIERFPQMELPKVEQIRIYIETGRLKDAEDAIKHFIRICNDPCAVAVDLCPTFVKANTLSLGINIFSELENPDSRCCVALALLLLLQYQLTPNANDLQRAYDLSKNDTFLGSKYILADVIRYEITQKLGANEDTVIIAKQLVQLMPHDYWFPLRCTEYEIASGDYTSASVYFNTFLERFIHSEQEGLKIDYFVYKYDYSSISSRVSTIISSFKRAGFDELITEQQLSAYQEAQQKKRKGFLIITDISSKKKGGMPLGNLIYKDLPDIPEGYLVYK